MGVKTSPHYQELRANIEKQQRNGKQSTQASTIHIKDLTAGTTVVNLLGTANIDKPDGFQGMSWIGYWEKHSGMRRTACSAQGCNRTDNISGSHVKIASGPTSAALLHTRWYIVPACPSHNRGKFIVR